MHISWCHFVLHSVCISWRQNISNPITLLTVNQNLWQTSAHHSFFLVLCSCHMQPLLTKFGCSTFLDLKCYPAYWSIYSSISFRCLSTLPGLLIVLMDVVMMLKLFPRSLIFLLSWPMMNRVRSKQEIVLQRLTRPWNRQKLVKHVNLFSIQFLAKFLLYNFKLTESTTQICQSTWLISTPTLDYW